MQKAYEPDNMHWKWCFLKIYKNNDIPMVQLYSNFTLEAMNLASEPSLLLKNLSFEELRYYVLEKSTHLLKFSKKR